MLTLTRLGVIRRPAFTPAQLADILAPIDPLLCGWLDGSCVELKADGDWLCETHTAIVGGAR